ncbi:NADH-FMN oxidoreductase RutF, flavin reductase (DIM6/NTAB) family [Alteromonadaceae bacterium Bs31]|nr:NADH-FMN oxidoreductase RutF, flavin reductase (DIM6/NTAB) family [Alteromonadaceae bacterium Bs31]
MDKSQDKSSLTMFDGMRRMLASVSIVTASNRAGERFAMTASSVTSVSAEPPSLLVCVNQKAGLDHAIDESEFFCVNVLSAKHKQVAVNCASSDTLETRFQHGNWHVEENTGCYFLGDAQAIFFCRKQLVQPYGTHHIYVGDVIETRVAQGEVSPLGYLNGDYFTP